MCNGVDDDCDSAVDEDDALDAETWYFDSDGDGWGSDTTTEACTVPSTPRVRPCTHRLRPTSMDVISPSAPTWTSMPSLPDWAPSQAPP